jgi:DNA polymerase-3 subunit alpha
MSQPLPFAHLHFHTEFSLLDGACRISKAAEQAKELGMTALAITDHGVMYGVIDFYKKAKDKGIKPILGCEAYLARGNMADRKLEDGSRSQSNHLVLLSATNEGYYNLVPPGLQGAPGGLLLQAAHRQGDCWPHAKGLIGTSACLKGDIPEAIAKGDLDKATALAGEYSDIFGKGNFFLELQNHGWRSSVWPTRASWSCTARPGCP